MTEHTKTPWEYKAPYYDWTAGAIIMNGVIIAKMVKQVTMDCETLNANAEFIVKAVNSHEALVDACKQALNTFTSTSYESKGDEHGIRWTEVTPGFLHDAGHSIAILKNILEQAE